MRVHCHHFHFAYTWNKQNTILPRICTLSSHPKQQQRQTNNNKQSNKTTRIVTPFLSPPPPREINTSTLKKCIDTTKTNAENKSQKNNYTLHWSWTVAFFSSKNSLSKYSDELLLVLKKTKFQLKKKH